MKPIKQYISRKTLLYKTGVEYGDYTINHVQGCSHGCLYPCYAFMMAKRFGKVKTYEEWLEPQVVDNALSILEKEIPKLKSKIQSVHLCFTTDPFMYGYPEISELSIKIISMLNKSGVHCTALTKGLLPEELTGLSKDNEYGITLISLNEIFRQKYEPYAADYQNRITSLRFLHEKGFKTWVSIEPYPTPNIIDQDFSVILDAVSFTDRIIFGKLNYNSKVRAYKDSVAFYNSLSESVIEYCRIHNKEYHIKDGTLTDCASKVE
jgi:DNA repair photolyase